MVAMTLVEFLSLARPKLQGAVLNTLVKNVPLQDKIKWANTKSLNAPVTYMSGIPTVSFRDLNAAPSEVKATWAQTNEVLKILEVDIVVDPVLLMLDSIQNIETAQAEATIKSIGYFVNDKLINGDDVVTPSEPRGILKRLSLEERFNGQTINATNTTTLLDIRPSQTADTARYTYLEKLDEVIAVMGGTNWEENGITFLCNSQVERANWSLVRRLKLLDTTKDQFDRTLTAFRGVSFIDVGFKSDSAVAGNFDAAGAATTQIIGNDADNPTGNGANAYTSTSPIYAVRFGDDYFSGLQVSPLKVKHLGQSIDNPHKQKINIQWIFGWGAFQKRAIARLVGLDVS